MPTPRLNSGIEFGWNGLNGYVKNNGKYQLLLSKPTFTFQYNSITYNSDVLKGNLFLNTSNERFEPTEEHLQEIQAYAEATAVTNPWEPVLNLPVHVEDLASLTGAGFFKVSSDAFYHDVKDHSTGETKVWLELLFVYNVTSNENTLSRVIPFQIANLNPTAIREMSVEGYTITGGSNRAGHNYRLNRMKSMSNDLELILNSSSTGMLVSRVQIKLSMFVPKEVLSELRTTLTGS